MISWEKELLSFISHYKSWLTVQELKLSAKQLEHAMVIMRS